MSRIQFGIGEAEGIFLSPCKIPGLARLRTLTIHAGRHTFISHAWPAHVRELGLTEETLADLFGVARETVSRWPGASTKATRCRTFQATGY